MHQLQTTRVSTRGGGFLTIVFIVLGLIGALVTWKGIEFLLSPDAEQGAAIGPLLIGPILLGAGLILPFVIRRARAEKDSRADLKASRPDKPWAWRKDWASGRIPGGGGAATVGLWFFALVWNGFTWPIAWLLISRNAHEEKGVYFVLLFPAAGLLLLGLAVNSALQRRKFGESWFVLTTNPGVVGRTLEGHVETAIQQVPADGVEVRLSCMRRYTSGPRNKRRTNQVTLWQDHLTVPPDDLGRGPSGMRIPVAFEIPADAKPHADHNPEDQIHWLLAVSAALPGVDYSDSFEVPVFDTGELPLSAAERERLRSGRVAHARAYVPEQPVMRTRPTSGGGTEFYFKADVKLGSAVGAVVMSIACWVGAWYLYAAEIPIAPWGVGALALLFTAGTVVALFHRSTVTVQGKDVVVRHRILGIGTTRTLLTGQISDVRAEVVGEGNAQSWEVKLHTNEGVFSAGAHVPTQREADWAAEQIKARIRGGQPVAPV